MKDTSELRKLLAEELRRCGNEALAVGVENYHDNNPACTAALRAMSRLNDLRPDRPRVREQVYTVIDGERRYQEQKRAENGYTQHDHELAAYITFMDDYLTEAKHIVSRDWTPACWTRTLDTLRKVVALGVACMEAHGFPQRL